LHLLHFQTFFFDVLFQWLWSNFEPTENEADFIPRDVLIKEALSLPEAPASARDNPQIAVITRIFVARYLPLLFPASSLNSTGFVNKNRTMYCLKRLGELDRQARMRSIPMFPEDLRQRLLKEVREELLGRKSASSLLSLSLNKSASTAGANVPPAGAADATPVRTITPG
jgi:hypothetical protein